MKIIQRSGLIIPREYETWPSYQKVKEHLTRKSYAYQTSEMYFHRFYLESEKFLLIPRLFPLNKYIPILEFEDKKHEGEIIDIEHSIEPRSEVQEKAIKHILENKNAILQLRPGVGKTVISIYMIAERKRKSLIVVHRDSLADQWRDRFLKFTNVKNISRLRSPTVEDDLKKPIIIATVQTLLSLLRRKRMEFLRELDKANIGVLVADEVHTTVGAPTFAECSIHIPAKYTYGLSATPYRYDGNGDIIEYHLGKIFTSDDAEGTMKLKVTVLLLDYNIDKPKSHYYLYWGGKFQRSRYLTMMRKSKPFTFAMRSLLERLKTERDMVVMIERKKIIDDLYTSLNSDSKSRFYGSEKMDQLNYKVTFSTPGKCRDGIDAPHKDCVITTSPISNIEQLTGRVNRFEEGKKQPIIIDMVDYGCNQVSRTLYKRLEFYESVGWEVRFLFQKDYLVRDVTQDQAIDIIEGR